MKKYILSTVILLSAVFTGCDYNEHNFEGLDELSKPGNVAKYEHTFTSSDFATIVSALNAKKTAADSLLAKKLNTEKIFSQELDPAILIPYILPGKYYAADINSSAKITYQYNLGRDTIVAGLSTPSSVMADADYKLIWGDMYVNSFTPAKSPEASIPVILDKNFGKPKKGTFKNVEYYYSKEEPVVTTIEKTSFVDDFEAYVTGTGALNIPGWTNKNMNSADKVYWQCRLLASTGNKYAQVSANASGIVSDSWLITKGIALTNIANPKLSFDINVGYYTASCLSVLVSTNYDGNAANINSATWANVTSSFAIPTTPTSGYGTFASAGTLDLSAYKGKTVYIAFRYAGDDTSTPKKTTTYQIDNIRVFDLIAGMDVKDRTLQYAAYEFNGTKWILATLPIVTLQPDDYKAMGLSFLTTAQAPNYLPSYLMQTNKYPQAGANRVVVYKTSKGNNYADRYTYTNGQWTLNNFVETRTDQFVLSTNGWIFDPTIVVNFQTTDYQVLVDYVYDNMASQTPSLVHANKNAEYYYGYSAFYKNISYRLSDRTKDPVYLALVNDGASDDARMTFLDKRTLESLFIYLNSQYSDLPSKINGADQYVLLNVLQYYDGPISITYSYKFQRVDTAEKWAFIERTQVK